jgi:UDP-N-acetylglucosamine transferase subunit ALG13
MSGTGVPAMTTPDAVRPAMSADVEPIAAAGFVPVQEDATTAIDDSESIDLATALRPMVVVSVGTDHHPFDRLVQWVDRWARAHPDIDVVIQYGSASRPGHARSVRYLSHTELVTNISAASVVVSHGGPATIAEAWRAGMIPLVTPRDSDLGEHVDNHQMTFVGVLAARGQVIEIGTEAQLGESLGRAIADPTWLHRESGHAWDVSASLRNIEEVIRKVTGAGRVRRSVFRRLVRGGSA